MSPEMKNAKRKVAAITAVMQYLQAEAGQGQPQLQASAGSAAAPLSPGLPDQSKMPPISLWGASGRQAQMQIRCMVQLKAFR